MRQVLPAVVLCPQFDTDGKNDATGAFQPKAREFIRLHGLPQGSLYQFNNRTPDGDRANWVISHVLGDKQNLRSFVVMCHGTKHWAQFGFTTESLHRFSDALAKAAYADDLRVVLYACSTAASLDSRDNDEGDTTGGEGGFADTLRDQLLARGVKGLQVVAHATRGHTTENPHVRFFGVWDPDLGGKVVIGLDSPMWANWCRHLREDKTFWARFPFMNPDEIQQEVMAH